MEYEFNEARLPAYMTEYKMKFVQKTALFLAASLVIGLPITAASAQKEDKNAAKKAPKQAKLNLSKGFIAAYTPVLKSLQKSDFNAAYTGWPSVRAAIANDDDKNEAGVFAYDLGLKMNKSGDAALAAKSSALRIEGIDLVLASTRTAAEIRPSYAFQKAAILYDAKDSVGAEKALIEAYNAGYRDNEIEVLISNTYSQQKKYTEANNWIRTGIANYKAANRPVPSSWLAQGGNYSLRMKDNKGASVWFKDYLIAEKTPSAWHDALATFNASPELELIETLDIFRLMHLTNSLKFDQEYRGYVETIDSRRYPSESLRVIQEGIDKNFIKPSASITQAMAEVRTLAATDAANASLSEASSRKSANAYDSLLTGESYMNLRNFAKAQEMYELAISKGPLRDREGKDQAARVYLHLAMAKIIQGNYAGGKADLAKIPAGNRKNIAEYWGIYADQMMAKSVAPAPAPVPKK
jgi:tetratricopeptide (TPR) repeat protein